MRTLTLLAVAGALAVAGCGGSANHGSGKSPDDAYGSALKFSGCMRSHGVKDFPDPQTHAGGGISLTIKKGANTLSPDSPVFKAAQSACRKYAPNGGKGPQLSPAQQQQFLRYAQCIRTHGVPNFPDPDFSGGGVRMKFVGVGPGSPGFDRAQRACQSLLPGANGKGGGFGFSTQGGPK
jgi:hypothetical protein